MKNLSFLCLLLLGNTLVAVAELSPAWRARVIEEAKRSGIHLQCTLDHDISAKQRVTLNRVSLSGAALSHPRDFGSLQDRTCVIT